MYDVEQVLEFGKNHKPTIRRTDFYRQHLENTIEFNLPLKDVFYAARVSLDEYKLYRHYDPAGESLLLNDIRAFTLYGAFLQLMLYIRNLKAIIHSYKHITENVWAIDIKVPRCKAQKIYLVREPARG